MNSTFQLVALGGIVVTVIVNVIVVVRNAMSIGNFTGTVSEKLKNIEASNKEIKDDIKNIYTNLDNHIPTAFKEVRNQMHEYSKVIDGIDKRLVRVETMLNKEGR